MADARPAHAPRRAPDLVPGIRPSSSADASTRVQLPYGWPGQAPAMTERRSVVHRHGNLSIRTLARSLSALPVRVRDGRSPKGVDRGSRLRPSASLEDAIHPRGGPGSSKPGLVPGISCGELRRRMVGPARTAGITRMGRTAGPGKSRDCAPRHDVSRRQGGTSADCLKPPAVAGKWKKTHPTHFPGGIRRD